MKRRTLHYDPHQKLFTKKSDVTIPRLLTPQEEACLQENEIKSLRPGSPMLPTTEILMNLPKVCRERRHDEETITKKEDEHGAMIRQTYSELCNLRKALDNDYGGKLITLWQRCLPDLFRSVNGLKEVRKYMEARGA